MHPFDRRQFLRRSAVSVAGLGSLGILPGCGQRGETPASSSEVDTGPLLTPRVPGSIRQASREEVDLELQVIAGKLPEGLRGHVFSVAALPDERDGYVFNGDGMLYRIDFTGDKVLLKSRIARTPSYFADQATAGTEDEFLDAGVLRLSPTLGAQEQANHAIVPFGDALLVTTDTGRPYVLDADSLELRNPLGTNAEWKSALGEPLLSGPFPAILTAAHPYFDANTEELFGINYAPPLPGSEPFTDLLRWRAGGPVQRWKLVDADGNPVLIKQSAHQVAATRDFVLVADTAFRFGGEEDLVERRTTPQAPDTPVYIIRRDALADDVDEVTAQRVVIPREILHFLVDYENPQGQITLHTAHAAAWDFSDGLRADDRLGTVRQPVRRGLRGMSSTPTDIGVLGRHTIDTGTGEVVESELLQDPEFTWGAALFTLPYEQTPERIESIFWLSFGFSEEMLSWRTARAYENYEHRQIDYSKLPILGRPSALFRLDVPSMQIADGYQFPPGRFATAPQFLPRTDEPTADATSGYILCAVISDDASTEGSSGDELWIFDAENLKRGPVCRLGHPQLDVAFLQHSVWVPELNEPAEVAGISVREDFEPRLEGQPEEVRRLFEEKVFPQFEK